MRVRWNSVTWYSKLVALALFVALPFAGFYFGIWIGEARQLTKDVSTAQSLLRALSVSCSHRE